MNADELARVLDAIDAINAEDPRRIAFEGEDRPKELVHAQRVSRWIDALAPDAGDALRIAGRAHHIARWEIPRDSHPMTRPGYLAWRRALQAHHAERIGALLREHACEAALVERVAQLVRKEGLGRDPEVQALEDAMCLAFFELQLAEFAVGKPAEKAQRILLRTLGKMSDAGRAAAAEMDAPAEAKRLLHGALRAG